MVTELIYGRSTSSRLPRGEKNVVYYELRLTKSKFMSGGRKGQGKGFQAERTAYAKSPKKKIRSVLTELSASPFLISGAG